VHSAAWVPHVRSAAAGRRRPLRGTSVAGLLLRYGCRMGTWGPGLFSGDLACDVREEFRDLIGDGLTAEEATQRILSSYPAPEDDPDGAVVVLALAVTQWKTGRLLGSVRDRAVAVIDAGADLDRWDFPAAREQRRAALAKVRAQLLAPQPAPVRIRRREKASTPLAAGDVLLYTHDSGRQVIFWVAENITDRGGTYTVAELLDIEPQEVIGDVSSVRRTTPRPATDSAGPRAPAAGFLLLGCQRLPPERSQILGRVDRPPHRRRVEMIATFVNPPARQTRIAAASLDRRLDAYLTR